MPVSVDQLRVDRDPTVQRPGDTRAGAAEPRQVLADRRFDRGRVVRLDVDRRVGLARLWGFEPRLEGLGRCREPPREIGEAESLPGPLPDVVGDVDVKRDVLRAGGARPGCELGEQRLRHSLPPPLWPHAGDVEVRAAEMGGFAQREAGELSVVLGDEEELAFQERRSDPRPRPRPVPVHRLEQLEHGGAVSCGCLADVHPSSLQPPRKPASR